MGQYFPHRPLPRRQQPGGDLDDIPFRDRTAAAQPGHRPGVEPDMGIDAVQGHRHQRLSGLLHHPGQQGVHFLLLHVRSLLPNIGPHYTMPRPQRKGPCFSPSGLV